MSKASRDDFKRGYDYGFEGEEVSSKESDAFHDGYDRGYADREKQDEDKRIREAWDVAGVDGKLEMLFQMVFK